MEGVEGVDSPEGPVPATEWAAAAGAVQRAWGMRLQGQGRHWAGLVWLSRGGAGRTVADLAMKVRPHWWRRGNIPCMMQ